MNPPAVYKLIPAATALAGAIALTFWLCEPPAMGLYQRIPGQDRSAADTDASATTTSAPAGGGLFSGRLIAGTGNVVPKPEPWGDQWPCFRGPRLDGINTETVSLARQWPAAGPKVDWQLPVGDGYAGAAIREGRVYLLDYDHARTADVLRCLALDGGKEIWRYSYPVSVKRNHGMSRTVPAVSGDCVVTIGPKCHVLCLDADTGKGRWAIDLVRQYHTVVPAWYAGQCPLIDDGKAILAPAGTALMIAVDLSSGKVLWQTPNTPHWAMTHSSIAPMELGGRKMYVYCGSGGVAGVDARDGQLLWQTNAWRVSIATVPTPVPLGGGRIFLSGGYNAGCMMLQVAEEGGQFTTKVAWRLAAEQFGATQQTPIYYKGLLYGVRPDGELVCLDANGKVVWTSGPSHRFGIGPFMIAGGMIYLMNDTGVLTLAEASPTGYSQLAEAKVIPDTKDDKASESWGPMALADGKLIVRDLKNMVCLDVKKTEEQRN